MMAPEPRLLANRALYKFRTPEAVRFSDLDALGHVNNNAYGIYFETGRIAFMIASGVRADPTDPAVFVAHLEIDYLKELHFPGKLEIGVGVLALGKSSVRLGAAVFQGEVCHAVSQAVMVRIDRVARCSTPLTSEDRAMLGPYVIEMKPT
jgi:acyl-CoA thioester hydrolase